MLAPAPTAFLSLPAARIRSPAPTYLAGIAAKCILTQAGWRYCWLKGRGRWAHGEERAARCGRAFSCWRSIAQSRRRGGAGRAVRGVTLSTGSAPPSHFMQNACASLYAISPVSAGGGKGTGGRGSCRRARRHWACSRAEQGAEQSGTGTALCCYLLQRGVAIARRSGGRWLPVSGRYIISLYGGALSDDAGRCRLGVLFIVNVRAMVGACCSFIGSAGELEGATGHFFVLSLDVGATRRSLPLAALSRWIRDQTSRRWRQRARCAARAGGDSRGCRGGHPLVGAAARFSLSV